MTSASPCCAPRRVHRGHGHRRVRRGAPVHRPELRHRHPPRRVTRHREGAERRRLEAAPDLLARGPLGVFYAVADQVVDEYDPVAAGLDADIEQIEDELFESGDAAVTRRIYDLTREVSDFRRATKPLIDMFKALREDLPKEGVALEVRRSFRDVLDHTIRIVERADAQRQLLQSALQTHMTLVAQRQNESVKKVSGWAAILFTPTLVATIYGMNFSSVPELDWVWGYPFAIALIVPSAWGSTSSSRRRSGSDRGAQRPVASRERTASASCEHRSGDQM